jgi:hypothetical protein
MAGLSNIFGGDDSSSSTDNNGDASGSIVGDLTSTLGLDVSSSNDSYSQDEDGNISSNSNDTALGFDTSTDGLLGAVGDLTGSNSSDETTSS